jgi:protein-L-isoaspartate O-methyltransferase
MLSATYSPEDNKLRLYSSTRLDKETYTRVRAAGFIWAPKQELFVAPMWTPHREDLLIELCGEVGDEDTSLVDRAEQRSERFEEYSESRAKDADQAHAAVSRIADGIPMGQPILVGHHSERHARKDAEKIENGMRRAVKMWETAKYWESRAAGAIAHAKYKEVPAVRARRIKGLESDIRVMRSKYTPNPGARPLVYEGEEQVFCGLGRGGHWVKRSSLPAIERHYTRWIQHCEMRLVYERAMLAEGGGLKADQFDIAIGGRVKRRGEWFIVTGLNRKGEVLLSVSVLGHWAGSIPIEEINDYRAPAEGDAEKVKAATKLPPLVNFRAEGCIEMTTADWKQRCKWSDSNYVAFFTVERKHTYREKIAYRQRTVTGKNHDRIPVFLTDAKVSEPPAVNVRQSHGLAAITRAEDVPEPRRPYQRPEPTKFDAMRESLSAGVKVVSAPQLFPTPADLAARMVTLAAIEPGERVLEPSAGTGNLVAAIREVSKSAAVTAVELNYSLADGLRARFEIPVVQGDFLEQNGSLGQFDVILMNPPFVDAVDIRHIQHAFTHLKPGGRLVALCANGPRQNEKLGPLADTWEVLPRDTFSGTSVSAVLMTATKGGQS